MIEKSCEWCGEEFEVHNYRADSARFCSRECCDESKTERLKGENNPSWRGGRNSVEFECDWCGEISTARQDRLDEYDHNFCSQECRGKWTKKYGTLKAENNPAWKGGKSWKERKHSGTNWKEQRQLALERDNHACQECGQKEEEVNDSLHVHHITPFDDFDDYKEANKLENLKTLCSSCHTSLHRNN